MQSNSDKVRSLWCGLVKCSVCSCYSWLHVRHNIVLTMIYADKIIMKATELIGVMHIEVRNAPTADGQWNTTSRRPVYIRHHIQHWYVFSCRDSHCPSVTLVLKNVTVLYLLWLTTVNIGYQNCTSHSARYALRAVRGINHVWTKICQ